jgi:pre-mRNA-processing factor 40
LRRRPRRHQQRQLHRTPHILSIVGGVISTLIRHYSSPAPQALLPAPAAVPQPGALVPLGTDALPEQTIGQPTPNIHQATPSALPARPNLPDEPTIPHNGFATVEEGEKAFMYLLRKAGVDATWTWDQTMRAIITDPLYKALNSLAEKKATWQKARFLLFLSVPALTSVYGSILRD